MSVTEAIVLAGGLGTRLRAAVPDLPKCMAPVAGKPFLHYVISYFKNQGIETFIFSLGYKHEFIEDFLQETWPDLSYRIVLESEPLGTGGAIKKAISKATQEHSLVLNGDTIFKISLKQLSDFHILMNADCTLCLKPMQNFDRYGVVDLGPDAIIKRFQEKKWYSNGLINGGAYTLNNTRFLEESLPEKFSFEKDYLEKYYMERRMLGLIQEGYFIDIGIPEDFARAQLEMTI